MRDVNRSVILANALVITLLVVVAMNVFAIPLITPMNGAYTTDRSPQFVWGGVQGEFTVFVDDDPEFSSPFVWKTVGNSFKPEIVLEFGTYYWKVQSKNSQSPVGKFTIGSSVVLGRDADSVKNEGNTDVMLHSITGAVVVSAGESVNVGEDEDVKAEQK